MSGACVLYNRQLHPDERKWAKDNADKFAQFYQDQTGQTITAEQAQQMLLAGGYRLVDSAASVGPAPDGNQYATAFISENGGGLFRAAPAEYNNPFLYGNADHSLTPEQRALPGAVANPKAGLAIAGGLVTAGLAPEIAAGLASIPGAPIFSSGGALGSAALASANGTGAISAAINAGSQYVQTGTVNPVGVAGAYATGAMGSSGGLLWNVGVNTLGGGVTAALNNYFYGQNNGIVSSAIISGVLSGFGYGAGKAIEGEISSAIKSTINSNAWANPGVWSGAGYNIFSPNNSAAIGATFGGGVVQEILQRTIQDLSGNQGQKK